MRKYADLELVANILKACGVIALAGMFLAALAYQSIIIMIYGLIVASWMYAIGGALLILIDIAKYVRLSALIAMEQDDRRKAIAKPITNSRPLGLKRIDPAKRKNA